MGTRESGCMTGCAYGMEGGKRGARAPHGCRAFDPHQKWPADDFRPWATRSQADAPALIKEWAAGAVARKRFREPLQKNEECFHLIQRGKSSSIGDSLCQHRARKANGRQAHSVCRGRRHQKRVFCVMRPSRPGQCAGTRACREASALRKRRSDGDGMRGRHKAPQGFLYLAELRRIFGWCEGRRCET